MMTLEQFEHWRRVFFGSTVQALRHIRDVPRAALSVTRPPPPAKVPPPPVRVRVPLPATAQPRTRNTRKTYRRAS